MTQELSAADRAAILAAIPTGRYGEVSEVADLIAYLCSPQAAYINGAVIPIDGGLGMGH